MLAVKEHPGISDTNNSDLFCAIAGTKKGNRKCDLGTLGRRRRQLNVPHQEAKRQSKKARAQILTVASSGYCNLSCIFLPRICTEKVRGRESGWEGRGGGGAVIVEQLCVMTSRDRIPAVASHLFRMEDINQVGSPALAASATFLTPACKTRLVVS